MKYLWYPTKNEIEEIKVQSELYFIVVTEDGRDVVRYMSLTEYLDEYEDVVLTEQRYEQ